MRRRLDLAAALVARPPVLFLDEPTTGLDPRSRLELWETIEGLVADGTTVLLTTQYLDEADRLADRIAVIDHGRVIADGTADELKDRVGVGAAQQISEGNLDVAVNTKPADGDLAMLGSTFNTMTSRTEEPAGCAGRRQLNARRAAPLHGGRAVRRHRRRGRPRPRRHHHARQPLGRGSARTSKRRTSPASNSPMPFLNSAR